MGNFLAVMRGEEPEEIPFWFMRQAGRYLPEYREVRGGCDSFLDLVYSPEKACEVTMQPLYRFGTDAAIIFSDILVIPHALGREVEFVEGEGPKLDPVETRTDVYTLNQSGWQAGFERKLSPVYEAVSLTRKAIDGIGFNQALIGFCGAPWTLACYMIEGGSSRNGFIKSRVFAYQQEKAFAEFMELLIEACALHLQRQIEAGAQAVQIFDSWAGLADSHNFDKWVIGATRRVIDKVRAAHPDVPIIGFPLYAGGRYAEYVRLTGVDVISVDHTINPALAARTLQPLAIVQGNLDPACLLAGGEALLFGASKIIGDLKNKAGGFVFNLGHGIHKDTPIKHVEMLINIIRGREKFT